MVSKAYVVVDTWKVRPGQEHAIRAVLARAHREFSAHPDILSVDYCLVDNDPQRYVVVFRYTSEQAREQFIASEPLTSTMESLSAYWEHDDVYVKGPAAELE